MNVTSKTHVRSSSGSSKLTHSWAPSVACRSATSQLRPELAGGEEALPELVHHHPFVGCMKAVAGEPDAKKENRRLEDAAEGFLWAASTLAREQRVFAPHPADGSAEGTDRRAVDRREGGRHARALGPHDDVDALGDARRQPGLEGLGDLGWFLVGHETERD